jgi:hypothetical protein
MDKKYLYIGGGVVVLGVGFFVYKKRQNAIRQAQARAAANDKSDAALASYLSSPVTSGSTPMVSYSAPSGGGGYSSPQMSAGTVSNGAGNSSALYTPSSLQAGNSAVDSQKIMAQMMTDITRLNNQSAYDLQRQQNQNTGSFNYAMEYMPFGGSVTVDTSPTGTTLNIDNKNSWDNQQFWNKVNSDIIYSNQDLKVQKETAPQRQNEDLIKSMYSAIGRETPDAAGVAYWSAQLSSGKSIDDFTKGFLGGAIVNPANEAEKAKAQKLLDGMK